MQGQTLTIMILTIMASILMGIGMVQVGITETIIMTIQPTMLGAGEIIQVDLTTTIAATSNFAV